MKKPITFTQHLNALVEAGFRAYWNDLLASHLHEGGSRRGLSKVAERELYRKNLSEETIKSLRLDAICKSHTGFKDFFDLVHNTNPNYRPSVEVSNPLLLELADAYDFAQSTSGDSRRAYRYGTPSKRSTK